MLASLGIAAALLAPPRAGAPEDPRPNLLIFLADDHATAAVSAYDARLTETPGIDRLAAEGRTFLRAFCANSLCGPARATLLTGVHSHRNGFLRNGERLDPSQPTFPALLRSAGYRTAVVGKWHLGSDPVGFDHWEILPGQGSYYNPEFLLSDGSRRREEGYCTDLVTEKALGWLREQRPDAPFLLICGHKAPHRGWSPAPRHLGRFDGAILPEPETLHDDYSGRTALLRENEMSLRRHLTFGHDLKFRGTNEFPEWFAGSGGDEEYERMSTEQRAAWDAHYEPANQAFLARLRAGEVGEEEVLRFKYQRFLGDYLSCVAAVDEGVGRILDFLEESGLARNTVVVYTSDQGFFLGEHGWYDKRWIFEESLRVPLLVRWPGVAAPGTRSPELVQNLDLAPTFLEMAGVPVPPRMQGRSLVPLLRAAGDSRVPWRDAVYYAYHENAAVHHVPAHDGIRTAHEKLAYFPRTGEWQLFDLVRDPLELRSVHDDPAYAGVLAGLQKRYLDLRGFYEVNSATIPLSRGDEEWWQQRFQETSARAAEGGVDLLFLGDSITQGWEGAGRAVWDEFYGGRSALNLGFSGDRTEHVLWRLTHSNLGSVAPRAVVLMIGTNNTGHRLQDPGEVAAGIEAILEVLARELPETQVLLLGVFPRGRERLDPGRLNNLAINDGIQRLASDRVQVLDLGPVFLAPDGSLPEELFPDALHPSAQGYRRWAEAMEPSLQALLAQ